MLLAGVGCSGEDFTITESSDPPPTSTPAIDSTTAPDDDTRSDPAPSGKDIGSADVGDPLMAGAGNGGYDVAHYHLEFETGARRDQLTGRTTITATATQPLRRFNLDLSGFEVSAVTVGGTSAEFDRTGDELTVTPSDAIDVGDEFTTVVDYAGVVQPIQDPGGLGTIGWMTGPSGSFIAAEPIGARSVYPCNDHPSDKATFAVTVDALVEDTVVANGVLASRKVSGDRAEWRFTQREEMATYLLQIAIGDYRLIEEPGPNGITLRHVIAATADPTTLEFLDETTDQLTFFADHFGPYPFENYGVLLAELDQGFALETQTLSILPVAMADPLYSASLDIAAIAAHELAHQWFGDSVSIDAWSDIWLNEGMATYAEWMWSDHAGKQALADSVAAAETASPAYRSEFGPIAAPDVSDIFSPNVYDGAALAVHALRLEVGDDTFFDILRQWAADERGSSASTADFEKTASRVAGSDLTTFFDSWLRSTTVPDLPR